MKFGEMRKIPVIGAGTMETQIADPLSRRGRRWKKHEKSCPLNIGDDTLMGD